MKDDLDLVQKILEHEKDDPVPADHAAKIRAGLGALLGPPPGGPPPSGGSTPQGAASGGSAAAPAAAGKWIAMAVVAIGAGTAGFVAGRSSTPEPIAAPTATSPASATSTSIPVASTLATATATPIATATSIAPSTTTTSADAFDKEQSLLERARSALVRHDALAAEEALDAAEKQFPRSRHEEERDYLRIQALREKGDAEGARARAKTFLARHPDSLLRGKVEPLAR